MNLTKEVIEANQVARTYFPERQSDPDYMPHLSLVYGDFDESTKVNTIIPKLQKSIKTIEEDEEENDSSSISTIHVDSIEIWSTQGDVKDWYKVETIPLIGRKRKKDEDEEDKTTKLQKAMNIIEDDENGKSSSVSTIPIDTRKQVWSTTTQGDNKKEWNEVAATKVVPVIGKRDDDDTKISN